jgi:hypothetical protein
MGFRIHLLCCVLTIVLHNLGGGVPICFYFYIGSDYDFIKWLPSIDCQVVVHNHQKFSFHLLLLCRHFLGEFMPCLLLHNFCSQVLFL